MHVLGGGWVVAVEGKPREREALGKVADHDVRSGASCACDERTPKLPPNERSAIETDSPTDLGRAAVRREGVAPRATRALERRSCTKREKQG